MASKPQVEHQEEHQEERLVDNLVERQEEDLVDNQVERQEGHLRPLDSPLVELKDNLEELLDTRLVELQEVLLDNHLAAMDNLKEDIHLVVGNLELSREDKLVVASNILEALDLDILHHYE